MSEQTTTARPEARIAAKWWADQLRQPPIHNNGDGLQSALTNYASRNQYTPRTDAHIAAFETALAEEIESLVSDPYSLWVPDNPVWGSAHRVVAADYGPDKTLATAGERVGLIHLSLRLPIKTCMWVNPGEVKVAAGYGAPPQVIWEGPATELEEPAPPP